MDYTSEEIWKPYHQIIVKCTCIHFRMEETWEHVFVHWQQGKFQLWANCLMSWPQVENPGPRVAQRTPHPLLCRACWSVGNDPSVKKWISSSLTISHTRHNSESILGRKDSPLGCLHLGLAVCEMSIMSEFLYVLDASSEPRAPESHRQLRHPLLRRSS